MRKLNSKENTKGVADKPFDKENMGATHGLNQSSQQKPGIEVGLYQETHYKGVR